MQTKASWRLSPRDYHELYKESNQPRGSKKAKKRRNYRNGKGQVRHKTLWYAAICVCHKEFVVDDIFQPAVRCPRCGTYYRVK